MTSMHFVCGLSLEDDDNVNANPVGKEMAKPVWVSNAALTKGPVNTK